MSLQGENMKLGDFNDLSKKEKINGLIKCCSSESWANQLVEQFPFRNKDQLIRTSDDIWFNECHILDWLQAFQGHPKIGDVNSLKEKYANTKDWAGNEQSGMDRANEQVIRDLAKGNDDYENKFGYIFIVCASGKSAQEMLDILNSRLPNDAFTELKIAIGEQAKITNLRIQKLLS